MTHKLAIVVKIGLLSKKIETFKIIKYYNFYHGIYLSLILTEKIKFQIFAINQQKEKTNKQTIKDESGLLHFHTQPNRPNSPFHALYSELYKP